MDLEFKYFTIVLGFVYGDTEPVWRSKAAFKYSTIFFYIIHRDYNVKIKVVEQFEKRFSNVVICFSVIGYNNQNIFSVAGVIINLEILLILLIMNSPLDPKHRHHRKIPVRR